MTISNKIKERRIEIGITQTELAKRMGYKSRSSINKIENGRPVSLKIIFKLAEALHTSPEYLMGWINDSSLSVTQNFEENQTKIKNKNMWNNEMGGVFFTNKEIEELISFAKYIISKR